MLILTFSYARISGTSYEKKFQIVQGSNKSEIVIKFHFYFSKYVKVKMPPPYGLFNEYESEFYLRI